MIQANEGEGARGAEQPAEKMSRSEMQLEGQAVRQRWALTPEERLAMKNRLLLIGLGNSATRREQIAALRVVKDLEGQNQQDDLASDGAPGVSGALGVSVAVAVVNGPAPPTAQEIMAEAGKNPEYLAWRRAQARAPGNGNGE
jgi:hypothetical protein